MTDEIINTEELNQLTEVLPLGETICAIGDTITTMVDISPLVDDILALTPSDGYRESINLIRSDNKMSTEEKLRFLAAEDDHRQRLISNNSDNVLRLKAEHRKDVLTECFGYISAGLGTAALIKYGSKYASKAFMAVLRLVA